MKRHPNDQLVYNFFFFGDCIKSLREGEVVKMESVYLPLLRVKFKGGCCCICPLLVI